MLSLLDFAAGWVSGWQQGRESTVAIDFLEGRIDVPKRSVSVASESSSRLGSATLWETGEMELEVVEMATQQRCLAQSLVFSGPEDLDRPLNRIIVETGR